MASADKMSVKPRSTFWLLCFTIGKCRECRSSRSRDQKEAESPHNPNMTPEAELLLFEASRSQLVREVIKPALERGMCVIADRFLDSTTVYQGAARKLDCEMIERLNAFVVGDCVPDISFVLDVDAATAESRMQHEPRKPDRMEQQPAEFYERVREGYRDLAAHESKRIVMIDGSGDVDEIEKQIWEKLCSRFPINSR